MILCDGYYYYFSFVEEKLSHREVSKLLVQDNKPNIYHSWDADPDLLMTWPELLTILTILLLYLLGPCH